MDSKALGQFLMQPSTADVLNTPVRRGGILPVTEYPNRSEFDLTSGLTGALWNAITAPARAARGEISEDQQIPEAFNFAGSLTLGSLLAPRPTGSVGMGGRAAKGALDMSEAARMARAKNLGYDTDTVWYHGANRADRIAEKGSFDPKRATSGPMQYFTDNPELASSYAKGKADTSMQDMEDIANYFTVSSKDLGVGRADIPLERSWHFLSPEQKQTILANMKRVGYENIDEATGPFKLHPEGVDASLSGSHLDYLMKEARGNPLTALREMWYSGGDLVNNPEAMMDVWKAAGYPHKMSDKAAPWFEAPGVVPTYLKMANPLDTSNVARMRDEIIPALEKAFKSDRSRKKAYGADMWDKNTRYTPKEWVQQLKSDLETGDNSFVWTSIPDKVTNALRDLGFDGIMDVGGKGGGVGHRVAIPFSPSQIRSVNAAFDPEKAHLANLLAANAKTGAAVPLATKALEAQQPQGIRYLDQMSRGAGEGSSNYVVFDDNLIEILRKYGLLGTVAGGGTLAGMLMGGQDGETY